MPNLAGETWDELFQTAGASYEDVVNEKLDATAQGHLANGFREKFFASGTPSDFIAAMHNYSAALEKAADDPASEAWLRCNRLNIYLQLHERGLVSTSELEGELTAALTAAKKSHYYNDPKFKLHTVRWLKARLYELYNPGESVTEETQALGEIVVADAAMMHPLGLAVPTPVRN